MKYDTTKRIEGFRGEHYCFSNFYPSVIVYDNRTYKNAEAAFQAQKSLDENVRQTFMDLSPRAARTKGRYVKLRPDWEKVKFDIMKEILADKFRDPQLREILVATDDSYLEETNTWHDNTWGNCVCDKCKNIPGKNMLGELLMDLRDSYTQTLRM